MALVHINYGQKTESRELQSFHKIADYYKVNKKLVFDFSHFQKIGGSSLTDKTMEISKANLNNKEVWHFFNHKNLQAKVKFPKVIAFPVVDIVIY